MSVGVSPLALRAGVDTWRPTWRLDPDSSAGRKVSELATQPFAQGSALLPEKIAGHRVQWFPVHGLLAAEGHPGGGELCAPALLGPAYDRLEGSLLEAGVPLPIDRAQLQPGEIADALRELGRDGRRTGVGALRPAWSRPTAETGRLGLARLDVTVDVEMPSAAAGFATLAALVAVGHTTPGVKVRAFGAADGSRWETVALHSRGGGVLGRIYDKGVESGSHPPGRLLRPEAQRRYDGRSRLPIEELRTGYVRQVFERRFQPLWQASREVVVGGPLVLFGRLNELVDAGEVDPGDAERLAGFVGLMSVRRQRDRPGSLHSRATDYRRHRELRNLGLALADGMEAEPIDVRSFWDAAMAAPGLVE